MYAGGLVMKKTLFTLLAVLLVFSANTNALANSQNQDSNGTSASHNLNGFQAEDGVTVKLVTRRHRGGHNYSYEDHRYGGHRHDRHFRSHRFGPPHRGFRFNHYRPFYKPYRNYYQRPYRGYNNYGGRGYSRHDNHRGHGNGHDNRRHNNRQGRGGHSSHNNRH